MRKSYEKRGNYSKIFASLPIGGYHDFPLCARVRVGVAITRLRQKTGEYNLVSKTFPEKGIFRVWRVKS